MIGQRGESGWTPRAELLAAYVDGELDGDGSDGDLRGRIERWLTEHPEAAGAVEAQRRLLEWFQVTAPGDPGETAWEPVAARLHTLSLTQSGQSRGGRWAKLGVLGVVGVACLGLTFTLASILDRQEGPPVQPPSQPRAATSLASTDMEAFPVATAAEVEILSVQGEDTATLVVGELPVQGSLVLLQADELTLTAVEPARDNMVPEIRKGISAPMIWAPLDVEREEPEDQNQS